MKAIPTIYRGVNFRSRLEARWAAFFDIAKFQWVYEPIDLDGWAPDFSLKTSLGIVYVEVKPVDIEPQDYSQFEKVQPHINSHMVLLCGVHPHAASVAFNVPGKVITPDWRDAHTVEYELQCADLSVMWSEAGNEVQWEGSPAPARNWLSQHSGRDWRV